MDRSSALGGTQPPLTGDLVTPYIGPTAQTTQTFNSTATTETVTGLTAGSTYTFTAQAINANGAGPRRRVGQCRRDRIPVVHVGVVDHVR